MEGTVWLQMVFTRRGTFEIDIPCTSNRLHIIDCAASLAMAQASTALIDGLNLQTLRRFRGHEFLINSSMLPCCLNFVHAPSLVREHPEAKNGPRPNLRTVTRPAVRSTYNFILSLEVALAPVGFLLTSACL